MRGKQTRATRVAAGEKGIRGGRKGGITLDVVELEFTSDQDELRASIRDVLAGECPIGLVREVVEKGVAPSALWERMVQLDWPALTVPEAAGGMGFGMVELAVLAEELGRAVTPAARGSLRSGGRAPGRC